jgi:hypothetical protein
MSAVYLPVQTLKAVEQHKNMDRKPQNMLSVL